MLGVVRLCSRVVAASVSGVVVAALLCVAARVVAKWSWFVDVVADGASFLTRFSPLAAALKTPALSPRSPSFSSASPGSDQATATETST